MRIYMAGPISGLNWNGATAWRDYVEEQLPSVECLSPLRFKEFLDGEDKIEGAYETSVLASSRGIYTRDRWDVLRSDVILVNLSEAVRVSIGTVMEIAWAASAAKPVVLVIDKENIHNHPMIAEAVGYTVETLDEGIDVVKALLNIREVAVSGNGATSYVVKRFGRSGTLSLKV